MSLLYRPSPPHMQLDGCAAIDTESGSLCHRLLDGELPGLPGSRTVSWLLHSQMSMADGWCCPPGVHCHRTRFEEPFHFLSSKDPPSDSLGLYDLTQAITCSETLFYSGILVSYTVSRLTTPLLSILTIVISSWCHFDI